jgi:O-antigen/teichoic acid export membrane protein
MDMSLLIARLRQNSLIVTVGLCCSLAFKFLRNLFLARLLTQSDYGVCVALSAVIVSATLISDMALDKMLVQERQVDEAALQRTVTSLLLIRALVTAAILLLVAQPLAAVLGVPQSANAFRLLSVSVAVLGFLHLDTKRYQRSHRFLPDSIVAVSGDALDFLFSVGGAYLYRSFYAVPLSSILSACGSVFVSRLLSERPFSLGWDPSMVRRALSYGLPLMASGLIILLSTQADRIIVGAVVGLKQLAIYGATLTIVSTPGLLAGRVALSVPLPVLADVSQDAVAFARRFRSLGVLTASAAIAIFLPLMLIGGQVIAFAFGARYRPPQDLTWIIAVGQAAALLRVWTNVGALALARTRNLLISNAPRLVGVTLALALSQYKAGLLTIAACFAFGEIAALLSSLWHFTRIKPGILSGLEGVWAAASAAIALGVAGSLYLRNFTVECFVSVVLIVAYGLIVGTVSVDARSLLAIGAQQVRQLRGSRYFLR